MKLKVILRQGAQADRHHHLQVVADGTATIGDVAAALSACQEIEQSWSPGRDLTLRVSAPHSRPVVLPRERALGESGLLSGSTIEIVHAETSGADARGPAVAVVRVHSGPDEGAEFPVSSGSSDIGRDVGCEIRLSDPQVSKRHARLNVGSSIEIVDTNSSNGVVLGGERLNRATLSAGDSVTLGASVISVVRTVAADEDARSSTDLGFIRSPRVVRRPRRRTVDAPDVPNEDQGMHFPWLSIVAPLLMGAILYLATRSALTLVFIALSPLLMIGNYLDQHFQRRRKRREGVAAYEQSIAALREVVGEEQERDRLSLLDAYPSTEGCVDAVRRLAPLLWVRRPEHPEFLQLRLGLGRIPATLSVAAPRPDGVAECVRAGRELAQQTAFMDDCPVVADLRAVGGVGFCGDARHVAGVARAAVLQVVALHSPAEVSIACVTSPAARARWEWLEWLPHVASPHSPLEGRHLASDSGTGRAVLAQLEELLDRRADDQETVGYRGPVGESDGPEPRVTPALLLVVDDPRVDHARLNRVAEVGPDHGIFVLWVAESLASLPAACRSYVEIHSEAEVRVGMVRQELVVANTKVESADDQTAAAVARALAPVFDAGVPVQDESDLPRTVSLVSLLGREEADDPEAVVARWRENRSLTPRDGSRRLAIDDVSPLRTVVGHAGDEPFVLDLRADGPHALVGGTTGAGKSEFLQGWVLGLAHTYSPDRVTFLFVDYKGGAAFAGCTRLPHCVGLVTDLSPHYVRRALVSLRAELHHRERLLKEKGAKDLITLERQGDPDCPPSLIIVVDEFAALATEVPEFVDGVVDIAQRGRSLGLHLILATQRPAGVIRDNLRANTNLRVALRMADESESLDVLGDKQAAFFPPSVPGRAAAKTGPGRIRQFQSSYPGARTSDVPSAPPIEVRELDFGLGAEWGIRRQGAEVADIAQDIDRLVGTLTRASEAAGVPAPRRPWLDSLASHYDLSRLRQRNDEEIVLGVRDDPAEQSQVYEYFRPDRDGNLLFVGASGTGKSMALRSLACAAAVTPRGGVVHVYGLDFAGGSLKALERMPHVGSIVAGDDEERVVRLIDRLTTLIDRRSASFHSAGVTNLLEFRRLSGHQHEPRILLLLDGFSAFRETYDASTTQPHLYTRFLRLLADGRAAGVHVAMTAERPGAVPMAALSPFGRRVVLRLADSDEYGEWSLPRDVLSTNSPPGRAIQVHQPQELQLAVLGRDLNSAAQMSAIDEFAESAGKFLRSTPESIRALPTSIACADVPDHVGGLPVLGMRYDDLCFSGFDPSGTVCVSGMAGSGRTNAVHWMAVAIGQVYPQARLFHMGRRPGALDGLPIWHRSAWKDDEVASVIGEAASLAGIHADSGGPRVVVVVESLPDHSDGSAHTGLLELVRLCREFGHVFIGEGETSTWVGSYNELSAEVRRARTGLLLAPDSHDGDSLLQTSLPRLRSTQFPPGRGYWVRGGRTVQVHVPLMT